MTTENSLRYCARHEINATRWDNCIEDADNGLIYARAFYLDIMAGNWDALILNDYEAVMPLTWNKKYGFYYLYQPYFVPFLGVFGKKMTPLLVMDFLTAIPKKFRYWNIDLNDSNNFISTESYRHLEITLRTNYYLHLDDPYSEIYNGYQKACQRRIRKAGQNSVGVTSQGNPAEVINFYREHYGKKYPKIYPAVYDKLIEATTICLKMNMATTFVATLPGGEITAAYLVLHDKRFVYGLIGGSSGKGKQNGSFYLITDAAIKNNAGSEKIFRFEGSDIPGIALFNAQFGAQATSYLHLNRNKLPFPVNLLK